ncbi:methyltransferase family protein [Teredinibacter waterburyi]|uniref:methyltransferase family protein n=1 Tax=Teredinibacter waterburyi TaxID=1500538 RepID=UPI001FE57711|nr:DUF1295 domain-containing protein [Teredinibacter waterburyi]
MSKTAMPNSSVDSFASTKENSWVTDRAWVCGVIGALTLLLLAYWYNRADLLNTGVSIFGVQLTDNRLDSILAAVFMSSLAMLVAEFVRLWLRDKSNFFVVDPLLTSKQYGVFLTRAVSNYLLFLLALWLVVVFFHTAGEYGFRRQEPFYRGWFRFLDLALTAYIWAGLPYVLITRAVKYNPDADQRDTSSLLSKLMLYPVGRLSGISALRPDFTEYDKKIARALLVKMFFTPLMTVFFVDQFPHLVANVGYLLDTLPQNILKDVYTHRAFNRDFFNISVALIFSIDVALAWCGYVVSSRWVDNQTISAEPSMLGWMVTIICYPPFQMVLGLYYASPGEREVLRFANQYAVSIFTIMMVSSYVVYMSATLWFGVRFSNLTNRGIIRKGPFALIRHPAYASKNFAWWCVMFPAIIYNASHTGIELALMQTLGLVLTTWIYYMRAITEERHLSADPQYLEYCKQVKYRFIPGVI